MADKEAARIKYEREAHSPASAPRKESSAVAQHRAGEGVKTAHRQDTQTRSRLFIGQNGPSDSARAAARGWRLRRPAADRHAARCASRDLCSGGAPRRYTPSAVHPPKEVTLWRWNPFGVRTVRV